RPNAVPANTMPAVGRQSAHGSGPSETPKASRPTANRSAICTVPTAARAARLATSTVASDIRMLPTSSRVPPPCAPRGPSARARLRTGRGVGRRRDAVGEPPGPLARGREPLGEGLPLGGQLGEEGAQRYQRCDQARARRGLALGQRRAQPVLRLGPPPLGVGPHRPEARAQIVERPVE